VKWLLIILLISCNGISQEDTNSFEDIIWQEVVDCMDITEDTIQPDVIFVTDNELLEFCRWPEKRGDACYAFWDNEVFIRDKFEGDLFKVGFLLREEYTHAILYQLEDDLTHDSKWFTQSGLCIHF
jgi:hypothetical protein